MASRFCLPKWQYRRSENSTALVEFGLKMGDITLIFPSASAPSARRQKLEMHIINYQFTGGAVIKQLFGFNFHIPGIGNSNSWDEYLYIYFNALALQLYEVRRGADELQIPSGNSPRHDFHILPVFHIFPTKFFHIWQYIPNPIIYQFMTYSSIFHILPLYDIYFHTKYFQIFCAI